jgi:D-3-phosphoglycerate dehydrogenase / 2-oxoglutarate reductase
MNSVCLIVQPIHPVGEALLRSAGFEPRLATQSDMSVVAQEARDATAIITRSAGLSAAAMDAAPSLRVVGSHGVGVNAIAVDHATALGIPVVNTPQANRLSVAEHTIALMLAAAKQIVAADAATRKVDFDFKYNARLSDISSKVLGIVGFGGIGRHVAAMAKSGFNMEVLVVSKSAKPEELRDLGYRSANSLDALLREADIVSLHLPLLAHSRHMIGARELGLMKPGAILINTARGNLIDEIALADALSAGTIAAAGLDVFENEHMRADHPLLKIRNAVLTPHIAGSSEEALKKTAMQLVERIVAVLDGTPMDVVNPAVWDSRRR